jgi:hypothetical protein
MSHDYEWLVNACQSPEDIRPTQNLNRSRMLGEAIE